MILRSSGLVAGTECRKKADRRREGRFLKEKEPFLFLGIVFTFEYELPRVTL